MTDRILIHHPTPDARPMPRLSREELDALRAEGRRRRAEKTPAQGLFWSRARRRGLGPWNVRSLAPVGEHIVDFYVARLRLAFVVATRAEQTSDEVRERIRYLTHHGVTVVVLEPRQIFGRTDALIRRLRELTADLANTECTTGNAGAGASRPSTTGAPSLAAAAGAS